MTRNATWSRGVGKTSGSALVAILLNLAPTLLGHQLWNTAGGAGGAALDAIALVKGLGGQYVINRPGQDPGFRRGCQGAG